ncbi:hypothetical protein NPIL_423861 [Nephila pilipes]|uniref:Uncharacterized protein n=1 Tax=Nephila pilipes TaxID=299642 RepID=A0A8X6P7I0_NEPPI|nr:hypothetical protein NPIL_423861 [Nephila pilipes]
MELSLSLSDSVKRRLAAAESGPDALYQPFFLSASLLSPILSLFAPFISADKVRGRNREKNEKKREKDNKKRKRKGWKMRMTMVFLVPSPANGDLFILGPLCY